MEVGRLSLIDIALAKEESWRSAERRNAEGRWWKNEVFYGTSTAQRAAPPVPQLTGAGNAERNAVAQRVREVALANAKAKEGEQAELQTQPLEAVDAVNAPNREGASTANPATVAELDRKLGAIEIAISDKDKSKIRAAGREAVITINTTNAAQLDTKTMIRLKTGLQSAAKTLKAEAKANPTPELIDSVKYVEAVQSRLELLSRAVKDALMNIRPSASAKLLANYAKAGDVDTVGNEIDAVRQEETLKNKEKATTATEAEGQEASRKIQTGNKKMADLKGQYLILQAQQRKAAEEWVVANDDGDAAAAKRLEAAEKVIILKKKSNLQEQDSVDDQIRQAQKILNPDVYYTPQAYIKDEETQDTRDLMDDNTEDNERPDTGLENTIGLKIQERDAAKLATSQKEASEKAKAQVAMRDSSIKERAQQIIRLTGWNKEIKDVLKQFYTERDTLKSITPSTPEKRRKTLAKLEQLKTDILELATQARDAEKRAREIEEAMPDQMYGDSIPKLMPEPYDLEIPAPAPDVEMLDGAEVEQRNAAAAEQEKADKKAEKEKKAAEEKAEKARQEAEKAAAEEASKMQGVVTEPERIKKLKTQYKADLKDYGVKYKAFMKKMGTTSVDALKEANAMTSVLAGELERLMQMSESAGEEKPPAYNYYMASATIEEKIKKLQAIEDRMQVDKESSAAASSTKTSTKTSQKKSGKGGLAPVTGIINTEAQELPERYMPAIAVNIATQRQEAPVEGSGMKRPAGSEGTEKPRKKKIKFAELESKLA